MEPQPTDMEIIRRVLGGDRRAYAALVDRYGHMVYTLAARMLGNRELAEETAQDAFLKAYQALDGFRGNAKFSTWLYRITYFRVLDVADREGRKRRMESDMPSEGLAAGFANETWEGLVRAERVTLVRCLMDRLPAEDSAVLSLHYLQELSLKEVGEVMELHPNTVKVRLHRARKRLKDLMDQQGNRKMLQDYGS